MLNRIILIGGMWLIGSVNLSCQELTQKQIDKKDQLKIEFVGYKKDAKQLAEMHLQKHKDCDLIKIVDLIETVSIEFQYHPNPNIDGWCFPDKKIVKPIWIFINASRKWNIRDAIVTIFHELFHMVFICEPDRGKGSLGVDRYFPVCRIFDGNQYTSGDISDDIRKHLREEFNNENILSSK